MKRTGEIFGRTALATARRAAAIRTLSTVPKPPIGHLGDGSSATAGVDIDKLVGTRALSTTAHKTISAGARRADGAEAEVKTYSVGANAATFIPSGEKANVVMNGLVYCRGVVLSSKDKDGNVLGHVFVHYQGQHDEELKREIQRQLPKEHAGFDIESVREGPSPSIHRPGFSFLAGDDHKGQDMNSATTGFLDTMQSGLSSQFDKARETTPNAKFEINESGVIKPINNVSQFTEPAVKILPVVPEPEEPPKRASIIAKLVARITGSPSSSTSVAPSASPGAAASKGPGRLL